MNFLADAGGFTPVPDKLVRDYDYTIAYVWGSIWRYCQMEDGACTAAHETIAKRAGMSRRTLIDKLDQLIEDGYIEDLTPDLRNRPHTYCTKKGEEKIKSAMQNLHTEPGDCANSAQSDAPAMQNLHSQSAEFAQPAMQNLHMKKDIKETPLRNKRERESHVQMLKRLGTQEFLYQNKSLAIKLSEICGNPGPEYVVNGDRRKLAEATAQLLDWGATTEQLADFRLQWWKFDNDPWINQVPQQWGRYLTDKQKVSSAQRKGGNYDNSNTNGAGHDESSNSQDNYEGVVPTEEQFARIAAGEPVAVVLGWAIESST